MKDALAQELRRTFNGLSVVRFWLFFYSCLAIICGPIRRFGHNLWADTVRYYRRDRTIHAWAFHQLLRNDNIQRCRSNARLNKDVNV